MAEENDFQILSQADWPSALTHEVKRILRWPAIARDSLTVAVNDRGWIRIGFSFTTETLLEQRASRIQDDEPIWLIYPSKNVIGSDAPAIWSAREDFPRDIGHLNPTPPDHPASLCLARAGTQDVYDRFGIDGVVDRLITWFHDAKTGQLMKDGWEPVPIGGLANSRGGFFNIRYFQELAVNQSDGSGYCLGVARRLSEDLGNCVVFLDQVLDSDDNDTLRAAKQQIAQRPDEAEVEAYIPSVFVWSDPEQPIERQLFNLWSTFGQMEGELRESGMIEQLPTAVMDALNTLTTNATPVAVLVGVWRPEPISNDVFGVSFDENARRLELRAYYLHCDRCPENPIDDDVPVTQLLGIQLPSREMLSFASGIDAPSSAILLGFGALGSCIGEFLLRSGIAKIGSMDKDVIRPHNLARHTANVYDLNKMKVEHLCELANQVTYHNNEIQCQSIDANVSALSDQELLKNLSGYEVIIDATADERVRRKLARVQIPSEERLLRAEIFNRGRLGTLFLTGPKNCPNAIDLYYELCFRGVEIKAVELWLRKEQEAGTISDELVFGMGCASASTRMPKYLISQHAAAFMPAITAVHAEELNAGIGINPLSETGTPQGWQWLEYGGMVEILTSPDAPGWEIRVSPSASKRLEELRLASGNNEAGGYLYGGYDFVLQQVYVVAVSDLPPGTVRTPTSITLGPAGTTRLERRIERCTGSKLVRVGTWHSHPNSGPELSAMDQETMDSFRQEDRDNGMPTLLLISSPQGNAAHIWI